MERYVGGRWVGIYHRETDTSKINASIPVIAREVSHALDWMENYTGIRYPFDVYNVVRFLISSMAGWSIRAPCITGRQRCFWTGMPICRHG